MLKTECNRSYDELLQCDLCIEQRVIELQKKLEKLVQFVNPAAGFQQ